MLNDNFFIVAKQNYLPNLWNILSLVSVLEKLVDYYVTLHTSLICMLAVDAKFTQSVDMHSEHCVICVRDM